MKYLVFCDDTASRRQIEDILNTASQPYEAIDLDALLAKDKLDGYDGVITEHETWQRNASILRYFDRLDAVNQKPLLVFSKFKKQNGLKLRRTKSFTAHHPLPAHARDVQPLLAQMA